jgi:hypothetical protein
MNESSLIIQIRDRASLDLLVTTDDRAIVDATLHAVERRLGAKIQTVPLRILRPETPDRSE